jgi:hypothetical protein
MLSAAFLVVSAVLYLKLRVVSPSTSPRDAD